MEWRRFTLAAMGVGLSLLSASSAGLDAELAAVHDVLSGSANGGAADATKGHHAFGGLTQALAIGEGGVQMGVLDGRPALREAAIDAARSIVARWPRDSPLWVHARWALAVGLARRGDQVVLSLRSGPTVRPTSA